jgi:DNA-binding response OmpR family regulator
VLLVEDDDELRDLLAEALRRAGHRVSECRNGMELLERIASVLLCEGQADFDLIVSDIRMPGITGMEIVEGLTETRGLPPILLMTAFEDEETRRRAIRWGAVDVLGKPFALETLCDRVAALLGQPSRFVEGVGSGDAVEAVS